MKTKPGLRATLLLLLTVLQVSGRAAERPNILWIVVEDMNPWLSCYGEKAIQTPVLDSMAEQGVRFDRFYVSAPVCSVSRTGLILGAHASTYGGHNHRVKASWDKYSDRGENRLPEGVQPINMLLQQAGYDTFIQGKSDFNFTHSKKELSTIAGLSAVTENDRPWFGQIQLKGGKNGAQHLQGRKARINKELAFVPPYYPNTERFKNLITDHLKNIVGTDYAVGDVIDGLRDNGELEDTIIFFLSDHGSPGAPRDKQFCYEGGLHVPLLVRWPKSFPVTKPGLVRPDLVSGIDLAPTTLALAGVAIPGFMQGDDVFTSDYVEKDYVFATRDRCDFTIDRIRAVVGTRYKYMRNYLTDRPYLQKNYRDLHGVSLCTNLREMYESGDLNEVQSLFAGDQRPAEELYDLENDPHEIDNLAGCPQHADILSVFRKELEAWVAESGDKGQQPESPDQLVHVMQRWGNENCTNPEYDKVRELYPEVVDLKKKPKKKGK